MNKPKGKLSLLLALVLMLTLLFPSQVAFAQESDDAGQEITTATDTAPPSDRETSTDATEPTTITDTATPTDRVQLAALPMSAGSWTQYGRAGHASASGDTVSFVGHPQVPFTTLLFRDASDGDYRILTFHLSEGNSDWHTLEGTGFIFNAGISGGSMNGYAVLFTSGNVGFYKLTNVNVSALGGNHFTALPGVSLIEQKAKPSYSSGTTWYLRIMMSPGTLKFEKYADTGFTALSETIFNTTMNDTSGGTGYGPFGSFISHDCESISTSKLEYFNLTIKPNTPPTISAPNMTIERGDAFNPMSGVAAVDEEDGDLTSAVSIVANNVNAQIPGIYDVTYSVTDLAGGSTQHTRKVTVQAEIIFAATEKGTGKPVAGVGVSIAGIGALADTNASGETSKKLPSGAYQWEITKQHKDYLPLTGTFTVHVDGAVTTWPLRVPFELEKKHNDFAVELTADGAKPLKYRDAAIYKLALTNNGNQSAIPTVKITVPQEIVLADATKTNLKATSVPNVFEYTHTKTLAPKQSDTVELAFKVTILKESATATLAASLLSIMLDADKTTVPDEKPDNNDSTAALPIKNPPTILTKIDALTKKPLADAELQILLGDEPVLFSQLENGAWVVDEEGSESMPTDKSGKLTLYGLAPDEYTIRETKAPVGYILPKADWKMIRDEEGKTTGDTELANMPTQIDIVKLDSYTKNPLSGVEFEVQDKDGKVLEFGMNKDGAYFPSQGGGRIVISGTDGKIILRYLPIGEYKLKETKTYSAFALSTKLWSVKVDEKGVVTGDTTIFNDPIAWEIMKLDENGKPLHSAEFSVTGSDGKVMKFDRRSDGIWFPSDDGIINMASDLKGKIIIHYLPAGSYTLTEVKAPDGYSLAQPVTVSVTEKHIASAPLKTTVTDKMLATMIVKVSRSGSALSGAGFEIRMKDSDTPLTFSVGSDGIYHPDKEGKETVVMVGGNGEVLIHALPLGEYSLTETVVPDGYFATTAQNFEVMSDHTTDQPLNVRVVNDEIVKLGFDSDAVRIPLIATALLLIVAAGVYFVRLQRKKRQSTEA